MVVSDLEFNYTLKYESLYPALNKEFGYIIGNWHKNNKKCINNTYAIENECIIYKPAYSNILYEFKTPMIPIPPALHSIELIYITMADFNSIILLGELNKYVSVSQFRFSNLQINDHLLMVNIFGIKGEIIEVTLLIPVANTNDWKVLIKNVEIMDDSGMTVLKVDIS